MTGGEKECSDCALMYVLMEKRGSYQADTTLGRASPSAMAGVYFTRACVCECAMKGEGGGRDEAM